MRRGLVFGHYDPLHTGHVRLFRRCREQCDHLTVIVNEVSSKPEPPLFPVAERVRDIADLRTVDAVMPRGRRTREEWIRQLQPAVVFIGEENAMTFSGVEVVRLPRTPGISSTELRAAARA